MRRWEQMRWTIVFAVILGAVASWAITPFEWYDKMFPVVTMRPELLQKAPREIVVKLSGEKHRDCRYQGIDAFSRIGDLLRDIHIERIDMPADGLSKPKGMFDFGTWRIWPTDTTKTVEIYIHYDCSGREVFVRAAEVKI